MQRVLALFECPYLVGDLPIYKAWFANLPLILGIKNILILGIIYVLPYQGLIFREIRDLEIGKSADKYLLCIFRLHIHNGLPICGGMAGWGA